MVHKFELNGCSRPIGLDRSLPKYTIRTIPSPHPPTWKNPQNFYEEAIVWKHLDHPNIVSLLCIIITSSPPQLISDWVSGGNLTEYIEGHSGADRLGLVSPLLRWTTEILTAFKLSGITNGLEYLHSNDVVHGNLKGVRRHSECS